MESSYLPFVFVILYISLCFAICLFAVKQNRTATYWFTLSLIFTPLLAGGAIAALGRRPGPAVAEYLGYRNDRQSWGWPARLMHWGMAGLILFQLSLGLWMVWVVTDVYAKFFLYQSHKSWGFVIFALALLRIGWRLANRVPEMPEGSGPLERILARSAHLALYLLMVALPLSGWLMASASPLQDDYGVKNMVFGWFELPDPFRPGDKALEEFLKSAHAWAAFGLGVLLAGHVAASLRHHLVERNAVLRRMILGR